MRMPLNVYRTVLLFYGVFTVLRLTYRTFIIDKLIPHFLVLIVDNHSWPAGGSVVKGAIMNDQGSSKRYWIYSTRQAFWTLGTVTIWVLIAWYVCIYPRTRENNVIIGF